jgi:hypothetical protein
MARTSTAVIEGLAQFYAEATCHRIGRRCPGALAAYSQLLTLQSGPYVVHQSWRKHDDEEINQAVYAVTIECRRQGFQDYERFRTLLDEYKGRLLAGPASRKPRTPRPPETGTMFKP